MLVCTFGDAVVDVVVELSRLPVADDDVPAKIALVAGGQSANVAAWAVALGARARLLTRIGRDPAGDFVRSHLLAQGVEVAAPLAAGQTGVIVSIATPDGRRTMASDRGAAATFASEMLDPKWLSGCDVLHVSGYALFGAGSFEAALAACAIARALGARISVDLSAATLVGDLGAAEVARRIEASDAELLFATEAEQDAAGDLPVKTTIVKRGAAGYTVIERDRRLDVSITPASEVRETTGAGDAFAAGWIVGGPELAEAAARSCVARRGAMPPPIAASDASADRRR